MPKSPNHTYNTRQAAKQRLTMSPEQRMQQAVKELYPDADRIKVTQSATGKGTHLRWQYSEPTLEAAPVQRTSSWSTLSSLSSLSSSEDGSAVFTAPKTVPRTPSHRHGESYPDSVLKAPHKRAPGLRREADRIGGGVQWWRGDASGVDQGLLYAPREIVAPPGQRLPREVEIHNREYLRLLALREWREKQMQEEAETEFFADDDYDDYASSEVEDHDMEEDNRTEGPSSAGPSNQQQGPRPLQYEPTEIDDTWQPPQATRSVGRYHTHLSPIHEDSKGSMASSGLSSALSLDEAPSGSYPEAPFARLRMVNGEWKLEGSIETPLMTQIAGNLGCLHNDSSLKERLKQVSEALAASGNVHQERARYGEAGPSREAPAPLMAGDTELIIGPRSLASIGWEPTEILEDIGVATGRIL